MGIKQTLDVINAMEREGIIGRYAIGGAVAAYNYVEPAVTENLDILVSLDEVASSGLLTLEPLFAFLRERGYTNQGPSALAACRTPRRFGDTSWKAQRSPPCHAVPSRKGG